MFQKKNKTIDFYLFDLNYLGKDIKYIKLKEKK